MPRTAMRCVAEIDLHAVSCPGVWLPRRDDVYVSVQMFNQLRQSQLLVPIFPLLIHEKFRFDKIFYSDFEPSQVADSLSTCRIVVELIQLSDIYEGGRLLASYESSLRDFLYPYTSYTRTYGTNDRTVLMNRTLDFPGISPKLEFSTHTILTETSVPILGLDEDLVYSSRASSRRSRSRSRSRGRVSSGSYKKPTISSLTRSRSLSRSRSVSPSLRLRLDALDLSDTRASTSLRPPFVVRKVDSDLIGRKPLGASVDRGCDHSAAAKRKTTSSALSHYSYDDSLYDYLYRPRSRITEYYPRYSYFRDLDSDDLEVAGLTSSYDYSYPRYRYSTLSDRYDLINSRVERALRRNSRSLERLDRATSPYSESNTSQSEYSSTITGSISQEQEQPNLSVAESTESGCTRPTDTRYWFLAARGETDGDGRPEQHRDNQHHRDKLNARLAAEYRTLAGRS